MEALWVLLPTGQRASGEWIDDTLRRRAEESGLLGRTPLAGRFPRQRVEVVRAADAVEEVNARFEARGWTDGLPITPPTLDRVQALCAATARAPSEVLGEVDPLRGEAVVEKVAANAVMAGCRPEHFPVVLAAVEAVLDPAFNMRGVQTTDENVAPLLIVSGPLAARLGLNAGFGALGPGWRANAAIGRALRLVMLNLGGGWPGAVSLAGLGQPGRYTLCLAERDDSPWPPLRVELGYRHDQTTVTVLRAETAINVTGGLAEVASVMASAASAFTMCYEGRVAVIVAPFVARRLAGEGWSKDDVRRWLHAAARVPAAAWRSWWLRATARQWPAWVTEAAGTRGAGPVPVLRDPADITVVVAGGDLAIPQLAYFPSWGFPPCRITREVAAPLDLIG